MKPIDLSPLRHLPRRPSEVWQGGIFRLPLWLGPPGGDAWRAHAPLWVSLRTRLAHTGSAAKPGTHDPALALRALVKFATDKELVGYLPGRLEVNDVAVASCLRTHLGDMGIQVDVRQPLAGIEMMLEEMDRWMHGRPKLDPALSGTGMTPQRLAALADAARLFIEAAPWRHLGNHDLVRVETPSGLEELSHLVVLGAGGREFGMILFESASYFDFLHSEEATLARGERGRHYGLYFSGADGMPLADADLFEDLGLPVAGPRFHPWILHHASGGRTRRPDAKRTARIEAILRALAATTETEIDSGRWTRLVPSSEGMTHVTLSLPELLSGETAERAAEPAPASTPLERAQDLCRRAMERRGRIQVKMAREALELSPDCPDAWNLLADHSGNTREGLRLYREGVAAGERALGPERPGGPEGHFWSDAATRPFMRALQGVADCAKHLGRRDEAVAAYRRLLELNPNDDQGVRYPLVALLLENKDAAGAGTVLDRFKQDAASEFLYARALRLFMMGGDTATSRRALRRALLDNPYVVSLLLDEEPPPAEACPGSPQEAALVCHCLEEAWRGTRGAMDWLRARSRAEL